MPRPVAPSPRRPLLLAALGLLLLAGTALLAAATLRPTPTQAAATDLWACTHRQTYTMRLVANADQCTNEELPTNLYNLRKPLIICVDPATGNLISNRRVTRCRAGWTQLTIPGEAETPLCVGPTGRLSYRPDGCRPDETPFVVPPRNRPPAAQPTGGAIREDGGPLTLTLSASDPDGDALAFSIASPPSRGTLGALTELGCTGSSPSTCTATVAYTPDPDRFGADGFTFEVEDPLGATDDADVTIDITPINDEPSFTAGPDVGVNEDSGPYDQPWASNVTAGPFEDGAQNVDFEITNNDNAGLFASGPTVTDAGRLRFTPPPTPTAAPRSPSN